VGIAGVGREESFYEEPEEIVEYERMEDEQ